MRRVGILYHPRRDRASALASELTEALAAEGISVWQCSAWDDSTARPQVQGSDLVFSIGGDGTILHAARIIGPLAVPIVGVNVGKLGFISEMNADEALGKLPDILANKGWIEDRAMLQASVGEHEFTGLNDVVIRNTVARLINVEARVDGEQLTTYRADGVIVATATGSTGYALAAGGPVLHPRSRELVLQPISAHMCLDHPIVLPSEALVSLTVSSQDTPILSVDGQLEFPMTSGEPVIIQVSPNVARFLRIRKATYFYGTLGDKLRGK